MKIFNFFLYIVFSSIIATLFACGGGGGGGSSTSSTGGGAGGTNATVSTTAITFSSTLPSSIGFNSTKAIAITDINEEPDQTLAAVLVQKIQDFFSIKSAYAAANSIKVSYFLTSSYSLVRLNMFQSYDPVSGERSPIDIASVVSSSSFVVPSITGIITSPAYIFQSWSNLYKPDATGKVDTTNSTNLCPILAIQRSSGKVSCIDVVPWCKEFINCGNTFGNTSIQTSGNGLIVFIQDVDQALVKVDLTDINNIAITRLTNPSVDGHLQSLVVNYDGDAYVNLDTGFAFQNSYRIYKASGGSITLNSNGLFNFINCPFSGPGSLIDANGNNDGNNFYFADESNRYWKISKSGGSFSVPSELNSGFSMSISSGINCKSLVKDGSYAHSVPDPQWNLNFVTELAYPNIVQSNNTPWKIDFSSVLNKVVDLYSYPGYLIVWGKDSQAKDVLIKYTKNNGSPGSMATILNGSSGYKILNLTVSTVGEITGTLQENTSSRIYLATINSSGLNGINRIKAVTNTPSQIVAPN